MFLIDKIAQITNYLSKKGQRDRQHNGLNRVEDLGDGRGVKVTVASGWCNALNEARSVGNRKPSVQHPLKAYSSVDVNSGFKIKVKAL